ncbi:large neutral amino acids transporter small subunit 2-like [Scylla paramamosain]|uniref:large neutral amino acids transporter small subunit 2-like n=1 Tax=Scylla paramamosain TaxID=85552 RepID=UPI003083719F
MVFLYCDLSTTWSLGFLTALNCWNVRVTTKQQDFFMVTKIGALLIVIIAGIVHLCMGNTGNFHNSFQGTSTDPGEIAVSFYSGISSYAGWNYLNFMTEELKNPFVNLPRAIYISLPLVTLVYVMANVACLAVLSPVDMLASDAIAVTFADRLMGSGSWVMPLLVALSAFGGLSVHIMTSSRLCFVGARQGHFPDNLALINCKCNTPMSSLIFLVNIIVPIAFLLVCGFLVFLLLYVRPYEVGKGLLITGSGVPAYFLFVYWQNKPKIVRTALDQLTVWTQLLFVSVKTE